MGECFPKDSSSCDRFLVHGDQNVATLQAGLLRLRRRKVNLNRAISSHGNVKRAAGYIRMAKNSWKLFHREADLIGHGGEEERTEDNVLSNGALSRFRG